MPVKTLSRSTGMCTWTHVHVWQETTIYHNCYGPENLDWGREELEAVHSESEIPSKTVTFCAESLGRWHNLLRLNICTVQHVILESIHMYNFGIKWKEQHPQFFNHRRYRGPI